MSTFDLAFPYTFNNEKGFQNDPEDAGNWTGGAVDVGELKGTKYGISAASYPDLDIENLTINEAHDIYLRDFWNPQKYAEIVSQPVATKIFDMAFWHGPGNGHKILQRALCDAGHPVIVDGVLGLITLAACNSVDPAEMLETIVDREVSFCQDIARGRPARAKFLDGWLTRARAIPLEGANA